MKRILSLSLVLMMVLSLFAFAPLTVSAAESKAYIGGETPEAAVEINQAFIDEVETVYNTYNVSLRGYFKLTGDITVKKSFYQLGTTDVVTELDGQNYTVTLDMSNDRGLFQMIGGMRKNNTETLTTVKNLKLKGNVSGNSSSGVGALVGLATYGPIRIENVHILEGTTVYNKNNFVGGFVGYAQNEVQFKNCTNSANVIGDKLYTGGFIGAIQMTSTYAGTKKEFKFENSYNYGDITSNYLYASGFIGRVLYGSGITEANETDVVIFENCGNEGNVTGQYCTGLFYDTTASNSVSSVSKCYNSGTIYDCGNVYGYALVRSNSKINNITDSFNCGEVYMTQSGLKRKGSFAHNCNLYNVYNAFPLSGINSAAVTNENVYTIKGTVLNTGKDEYVIEKTEAELKELASTLGENFKTATPTKTSAYPYPQIVGNEYVEAAASVPATLGTIGGGFSANEDISGTYADGEISYTGAYVAGFGVAQDLFGWEKTYGMILTDANGVEYEADAVENSAVKASGNYGVLFYGSKLVPGEYTLTPYVTYTNYGETHQVKGEAKTVTVAE